MDKSNAVNPPGKCDIAIIGGGPSGSSAANKLASLGYHVVLLDKARHPRPNVGESVIPHFWRYADALNVSKLIEEEGFVAKSGGLALWGNELRRLRFRDFGHARPALHVERDIFDDILLRAAERAGAQVFEEVWVTSVAGLEDPLVTVNYTNANGETCCLKSRYLIDASGQAAVVARQMQLRVFDEDLRFSAFWGYYQKSRYLTYDGDVHDDVDKYAHRPATLVSSIGDWGWAWNILMRKTASVGVILPTSRLAELRGKTQKEREQRFQAFLADVPLMGSLLDQDDFIPGSLTTMRDYAYKPNILAIGSCYLTGDAAAFVDPINSLGVVFGMYSGMIAAHAIARSLENSKEAEINRDLYTSQYGNRIALFRLLALPEGAGDLSSEELAQAKAAINASSDAELQLIVLQASVNVREGRLSKVLDDLGVDKRPDIESIDWQALAI